MTVKTEILHITDPCGRQAKGILWMPDTPVWALVQISHGMTENIERYERFAAALCDAGIAVMGSDQPGHGLTVPEEELGYFHRKGWDGVIGRLHGFTRLAKERFPGVPLILLGHSMGSFMARAYCTRFGEELAGAVFMGTSGPNPAAGAGLVLVRLMALFKGWHGRCKLVDKMMFGAYNKKFPGTSPFRWLSKDEEEVAKYEANDRCGFLFTLDGYETLLEALRFVSRRDWAEKLPKDVPVLVISGEDDPVGNYGKGVRTVAQRLTGAGVPTQLKLYPGDRHEILNEVDRDAVTADILTWIEGILKP